MYRYETKLWAQGYRHISGCDEAGRGPLAGPVVAAAVILDPIRLIEGIDDSKKLSPSTRERLAKLIKETALSYSVAVVSEKRIDQINILEASKEAMSIAIRNLSIKPDYILTDALSLKGFAVCLLPIIKGDQQSASIAAASIIAKTTRDEIMVKMDVEYPGYGFAIHKGYPTKAHLEAIDRLGVSAIHRLSYKPVKTRMNQQLSFELGSEEDD
jgi:ribonuclease HII